MIVSRADVLGALVAGAVLIGLPACAFAQAPATGSPRSLGQPVDATQPPPGDATTLPAAPPVLGHRGAGAVTVLPLGASEGEAVGLLDDSNGGFGATLWSSMDRATADELLSHMPVTTRLPALRSLARRLLLTKADSPIGAAEHSFLTIRLQKLLEGGFIDEAGTIAATAKVEDDAEFARVQADAILYANRAADACGDATATRLTNAEPFWIELRAYCYAVSGNGGLLDLTRSVMDAQGLSDPAFDTLLEDVVSKKSKLPGDIAAPTSFDLFLLRQAGLPVPPPFASALGGPATLIAARDAGNSPNDRLAAAERAIFTGGLSADELTALADAAAFSPDQLSRALDIATDLPFLKSQALLRQAALRESDPSRKVQLVLQALQLGEKNNLFSIAAVLQHAPAASIKPIAAMRSMAPPIARALLLAGDADAAEKWCDILDPKMDAGLIARLRAEINLIASNPARQQQAQAALAYLATRMPAPAAPVVTAEQAADALVLGVYATNGEAMPQPARAAAAQNILWPGRRPMQAQMQWLENAVAARGQRGNALVSVLDIVGENGPGDFAPDVTLRLVTALVQEGMADTARSFAIDALLLKQ